MARSDPGLHVVLSTSVGQRGRSGVASYLAGLVDGLLGRDEPGFRLTLVGLEGDRPLFAPWLDRCGWEPVAERWRPAVRDIFWHQFLLPARLRRLGADVVHIPSYRRVLARPPCPQVLTIHDCASFQLRGKYDALRNLYTRRVVVPLARRADEVVTVSAATAADVTRFYGRPRDRIDVVWNGIDHRRFRPEATGPRPVPEPYFLYLARLEHPAKNHVRLVAAFETLLAERPALPHRLVLAGADWHGAAEIHRRVAASPVRDRILTPGFVRLADLPGWYAAATAMVYPSLFEGFGLPPVEAMACGCPVVCSDRGSLGEVVGDAARRVDPEDPADIARGLAEMVEDAARGSWRERGLRRAALFSWVRCARETLAVYRRASRQP
jgi:glycosyltransferase involved in cell wall biosynthesis